MTIDNWLWSCCVLYSIDAPFEFWNKVPVDIMLGSSLIFLFEALVFGIVLSSNFEYPANEYEYSLKRDWLKEAEQVFEGKDMQLTKVRESQFWKTSSENTLYFEYVRLHFLQFDENVRRSAPIWRV